MRTDLLTSKEAADYLGVAVSTVSRWVREGSLPAYRIGQSGPLRIKPEDVADFLQPVDPSEPSDLAS